MNGILGIAGRPDQEQSRLRALVRALTDAAPAQPQLRHHDTVALGRVHRGTVDPASPVTSVDGPTQVAFHGRLWNAAQPAEGVHQGPTAPHPTTTEELILRLYQMLRRYHDPSC